MIYPSCLKINIGWLQRYIMEKQYHEALKTYLFQLQNYADNLLKEKCITTDEHFKIHEPLLALSKNLVVLEPKESENDGT